MTMMYVCLSPFTRVTLCATCAARAKQLLTIRHEAGWGHVHCGHSSTGRQQSAGRCKTVNGSRYYRALETVSIASALSSALTIYPCQIRVHQMLTVLNSNFLQLGRRSGGRPQLTVYPRRLPGNCETHYVSRHRTHNLPIVSPTHYQYGYRGNYHVGPSRLYTVIYHWLIEGNKCN